MLRFVALYFQLNQLLKSLFDEARILAFLLYISIVIAYEGTMYDVEGKIIHFVSDSIVAHKLKPFIFYQCYLYMHAKFSKALKRFLASRELK